MRKLVVTQFMSLDGVIENPMWTFPYWNDEIASFKGEETDSSDTLLLGRVTYEGFAQAWPNSKDEGADYFNNVRKYVVSTTLDKAEWNNSVIIKENVVDEIKKLKQQAGTNITVHGSANLAQTLMQHDLVDSYRFLIYPLVVGKGQRFFMDSNKMKLKLTDTRTFATGVTGLIYEPERK